MISLKSGSMGSVNQRLTRLGATSSSELADGSDEARLAWAAALGGSISHQPSAKSSTIRPVSDNARRANAIRTPAMGGLCHIAANGLFVH